MARTTPRPLTRPRQAAEASGSPPSAEVILDVLSKAGAIFFRWDPFGGLTFLSASSKGLLGYTRDELMSDPNLALRIIDPEFLPQLDQLGAGFYVVTGEAVRVSFPFIARSGGRVWMEARVVPEIGSSGAVTGFLGIALQAPLHADEEAEAEPTVPETVPE